MSRYGHSIYLIICGIQLLACLYSLPVPAIAGPEPGCRSSSYDRQSRVQYVIDGDTVILADGTKVRLIGIDTPELGHDGNPDQPYARQARAYLVSLLHKQHDLVYLVHDQERHDKYQRTLAHLFLPDGTSVEALILAQGLATLLAIPPNLRMLDCYRLQTQLAIDHGDGIWQLPQYQPRPAAELTGADRGFRIIRGEITHIGRSRDSVWLDMGRKLGIRIIKNDLRYFAKLNINTLTGKTVQVRGMVYQRNGQLRVRIRHPVNIQVLGN